MAPYVKDVYKLVSNFGPIFGVMFWTHFWGQISDPLFEAFLASVFLKLTKLGVKSNKKYSN